MKSRIIFAVILLAAFVAFYLGTIRPAMTPIPLQSRPPIANRPTPNIPPSVIDRFEKMVLPPIRIPAPAIVTIHLDPPVLKMEIPLAKVGTLELPVIPPGEKSPGLGPESADRSTK